MFKRGPILSGLLALALVFGLGVVLHWLTDSPDPVAQTNIVSLAILSEKKELRPQEQTLLHAAATYSDGARSKVTEGLAWHSSNDAVAAVDPTGRVEARKDGTADIVVQYEGVASPALTVVVKRSQQDTGDVQDYLKRAGFYRDRGDYLTALMELGKAKALEPHNKKVGAEMELTRQACLAEQRLGLMISCE
jgi:hypothetical protein